MTTLYLVLYLLAAVFFFLSAFSVNVPRVKVNLIALGLFCWVLVPLIQAIDQQF